MIFPNPLIPGTLIKRYKRFLADIQLNSGEIITAHTPNSGSMRGLLEPGNPVYLSKHESSSRKLKYGWELVQAGGVWVGINTHLPNALVEEAITLGLIPELQGYTSIQREVKYGKNSRIDLLLCNEPGPLCYVEVKNVTLVENGVAYFPDAVTERGRKHLEELIEVTKAGQRAVMFFVLQREDGSHVAPADFIDPAYGEALRRALAKGVEAYVYRAKISHQEICLTQRIELKI